MIRAAHDSGDFERTYAAERDALLVERMHLFAYVCAAMVLGFWSLDWLVAPEYVWSLGATRLAVAAVALSGRAAMGPGSRYNDLRSAAIIVASSFGLSVATRYTGHFSSFYLLGVVQIAFFVGFFIPWTLERTVVVTSLMGIDHYLANLDRVAWEPAVIAVGFGLLGLAILTSLSAWAGERARRRDLRLRTDVLRANEELRRAGEARMRFFANVNHELRTPLMLILGPLQRLLAAPDVGNAKPMLEIMDVNAERLLRQVNLTLDFAKVEAGRLRAALEPGNLEHVLRRMSKAAQGYAELRGVQLRYDGGAALPDSVFDPEQLETILANLLSNAVKFTPRGGEVTLVAARAGDELTVEVRDTGEGVPPEHLERIFDPFHQVDGGPSRRHEGTGLGLALSRELARLHGGDLRVESVLGKGACFRLTLPLHPPARSEEPGVESRNPAERADEMRREGLLTTAYEQAAARRALFADLTTPPVADSPSPLPASPGTPHLLLVEDNDDLRAFLRQVLGTRFVVDTACNGLEALVALGRRPPDLVIADVMMPFMDGIALCRKVRDEPRWASLPVILLTAKTGAVAVVEGLGAGANDYIAKPFDVRELEARIDAQLRLRTLEQSLSERDKRLTLIGTMTNSIAHDLTNPLTALRLLADQVQLSGNLDDATRKHVVNIESQTERLCGMVRDIRDFAKLGTVALQLRPTPFAAFIAEIGLTAREHMQRLGIEFQIEAHESAAAPVALDRERIRRVIENLLRNAQEAFEAHRASAKRISMRARGTAGGVELHIADSGPGVRAEIRDRLFEPFVTAGKHDGTGLGLAIVRDLVTAHGGTIELVDSATAGGAVFRMWLPQGDPAA